MGNTSGERQLQRSVRLAMDAVQRFGPLANPSVASLHLSFQYLCCYNHTELAGIARAIRAVKWAPVSATFNRIVCAAGEFVALASPASQGQLFGVVAALEEAMARAGYLPKQHARRHARRRERGAAPRWVEHRADRDRFFRWAAVRPVTCCGNHRLPY